MTVDRGVSRPLRAAGTDAHRPAAAQGNGAKVAGVSRPVTFGTQLPKESGRKFDSLPPEVAAALAWTDAGSMPKLLAIRQDAIREIMPNLARALDRLSGQE
jgi:hypothetical protein